MANLSNINNKFLVTTGGNVLIGATADVSGKLQITGIARIAANASYYSDRTYLGDTWEFASDTTDGVTFKITGGAANTTGNFFKFQTQAGGATAATALTINKDLSSTFAGNVNISSPGDLYINSGTSYNNVGSVFMSNQRTEISSIIVDGTAQGDTALNFKTRSAGSTASAMFINEFRRVGIGTDSPDAKLHIYGSSSLSEMYLGEDAAADKAGILKYTQGDGSGTGVITLSHWGNTSTTQSLAIKYGGNVGIGTISPQANLHIDANSGILTQEILKVKGGGSGGAYGFLVEANNGDDLFKVDTSTYNCYFPSSFTKVGIGTDSPNYGKLQIDQTAGNNLTLRKGIGYAAIAFGGVTNNEATFLIEGNANQGFKIYNGTGTLASPTWTAGMDFYDGGRLYPYGGVFLGSSNTSNLLNDYEEGTWTPTIVSFGGAAATLSTANGTFTKIGRKVFLNYDVRMSSKASMTGAYVLLGGLPFNHPTTHNGTGTIDFFNNMTTAFSSMAWDTTSTGNVCWLVGVKGTSATSSVYVTVAEISDTTQFKGTIIYHT